MAATAAWGRLPHRRGHLNPSKCKERIRRGPLGRCHMGMVTGKCTPIWDDMGCGGISSQGVGDRRDRKTKLYRQLMRMSADRSRAIGRWEEVE